jgi:hypothetical protein
VGLRRGIVWRSIRKMNATDPGSTNLAPRSPRQTVIPTPGPYLRTPRPSPTLDRNGRWLPWIDASIAPGGTDLRIGRVSNDTRLTGPFMNLIQAGVGVSYFTTQHTRCISGSRRSISRTRDSTARIATSVSLPSRAWSWAFRGSAARGVSFIATRLEHYLTRSERFADLRDSCGLNRGDCSSENRNGPQSLERPRIDGSRRFKSISLRQRVTAKPCYGTADNQDCEECSSWGTPRRF